VKLQFGGDRSKRVPFIGSGGVIRTFDGFVRGVNRRDAVANTRDSKAIIEELWKNPPRLAWDIDNEDGFDSLEVHATEAPRALSAIGCAK
jgi:hypothetical protein